MDAVLDWLPGLLVSLSMGVASYQDVKMRSVDDMVWIPGIAGLIALFTLKFELWPFLVFRLFVLGLLGLIMVRLGRLGEADGIALVLLGVSADPATPLIQGVVAGLVALAHLAYLFSRGWVGKRMVVPADTFLKEERWIPRRIIIGGDSKKIENDVNIARDEVEALVKARAGNTQGVEVEVQYGVPLATYLGLGYIAGYILFLIPSFT